MSSNEELVARADCRPGYSIVNYRSVALPVFRILPLLTIQAQKPVGPIEEFVLKSLELGLPNVESLSSYLGLSRLVIEKQLGSCAYEGLIKPTSDQTGFVLTSKGKEKCRDLQETDIKKEVLPFYIDGITREVIPIRREMLYGNQEVQDMGLGPIPPIPRKPPRGNEVDLYQVNQVLSVWSPKKSEPRRALRVEALTGKTRLLYRPALAIGFKSESGRTVSVGFWIDGRESELHESVFMSRGEGERSRLFRDLFDARRRRVDLRKVYRETETMVPDLASSKDDTEQGRKTLTLKGALDEEKIHSHGSVETLSVYEHPPLLRKALEEASDRVLIVSPWLRANVVNDDFIDRLQRCLKRQVKVTIAFGIAKHDPGAREKDKKALQSLEQLEKRYNNFELKKRGNTHAKVLLVDSRFFVTTSFNWLSFEGDPERPFREEEGVRVGKPELVDSYYEQLMQRMEEHGSVERD